VTTPALLPRPRSATASTNALTNASTNASTDTPATPDDTHAAPGPLMIVVGGVPGAGKSTVLARVAADVPRARKLDPDTHRRRIARRLPSWVPYGTYRWAVHTLHAALTLLYLVRGPRRDAPLLVHDTATRVLRLESLGRIARWRGWTPVLVTVDASLDEALDGQLDRGHVLRPSAFARHWERWSARRATYAAADGGPSGPWSAVHLKPRCEAYQQVHALAMKRSAVPAAGRTARVAAESRAPGRPCAA